MIMPVTHGTWQTLRTLVRSRTPVLGSELRICWTRRTKDGTFLTELVSLGLIEVVHEVAGKPFESRYKLTEAGKFAAEYGEYECDLNHVAVVPALSDKPESKKAALKGKPKK